eukprot:CAMPEP_0201665216 /NCGR_PEP_ID=MMETSP0494-20130426/6433_1 /ASSEMBLY_ACC=CAM_ASM_000839 /TAXON_ID=420259 /ORGANISM="Thalassiosira gravida, Strain GMp14c1" /LENGTH=107 /DNA_ID=CAMNT_0048144127 /DNA_START=309 /DNA_END=629 /DNA_ORIENTATION=+
MNAGSIAGPWIVVIWSPSSSKLTAPTSSSSTAWQHMMWRVISSFPIPVVPHSGGPPFTASYGLQVSSGPTEIQPFEASLIATQLPFGSSFITSPIGMFMSAMGQYAS